MQWWGALLKEDRPFGVTRAGGLLVVLGAMNTLQILLFLMAWLGPVPLGDEYRRLALTMTPIQVVYGIVRLGIGLAVLQRVTWSPRAGIAAAALETVGVIFFVTQAWGVDIGPGPEPPFFDSAVNGMFVVVVIVIMLIDGSVIRDLIRHRQWFVGQPRGGNQ